MHRCNSNRDGCKLGQIFDDGLVNILYTLVAVVIEVDFDEGSGVSAESVENIDKIQLLCRGRISLRE